MTKKEIKEKIKIILLQSDSLPDSFDKTTIDNVEKISELGLDSLDYIEILFDIEDGFGIDISEEVAKKLDNIDDFTNYISSKLLVKQV